MSDPADSPPGPEASVASIPSQVTIDLTDVKQEDAKREESQKRDENATPAVPLSVSTQMSIKAKDVTEGEAYDSDGERSQVLEPVPVPVAVVSGVKEQDSVPLTHQKQEAIKNDSDSYYDDPEWDHARHHPHRDVLKVRLCYGIIAFLHFATFIFVMAYPDVRKAVPSVIPYWPEANGSQMDPEITGSYHFYYVAMSLVGLAASWIIRAAHLYSLPPDIAASHGVIKAQLSRGFSQHACLARVMSASFCFVLICPILREYNPLIQVMLFAFTMGAELTKMFIHYLCGQRAFDGKPSLRTATWWLLGGTALTQLVTWVCLAIVASISLPQAAIKGSLRWNLLILCLLLFFLLELCRFLPLALRIAQSKRNVPGKPIEQSTHRYSETWRIIGELSVDALELELVCVAVCFV